MSVDDRAREEQTAEEWRDWLGRSLDDASWPEYAPPVDPEVAAILEGWRNGDASLPWNDAGPEVKSSSEGERAAGLPAAGEGTAA